MVGRNRHAYVSRGKKRKIFAFHLLTSIFLTAEVVGEIMNFAAYAFAPAIMVTPLGALSVLIG
jgi:hypothetical protein